MPIGRERELIHFPPHSLLILEERLRESETAGEISMDLDVTHLALRILGAAAAPIGRPELHRRLSLDIGTLEEIAGLLD